MNKSIVDDSVLVSNYLSGDESALSVLIAKNKKKIFSFIYSKVNDRDKTEDLFQDTFIKVIQTLKHGNYNEEGKFLSWVMRIAHNLVIDYFRKRNRLVKYEHTSTFDIFSVLSDSELNIEEQTIKKQIDKDVRLLLEDLCKDQKEIVLMRVYKDMSFKDISEVMGISINTALGRMRYAILNMRKIAERKQLILTR